MGSSELELEMEGKDIIRDLGATKLTLFEYLHINAKYISPHCCNIVLVVQRLCRVWALEEND